MKKPMDMSAKTPKTKKLLERFRESRFPPAAVVGAFCSFASAASGSGGERSEGFAVALTPVQIESSQPKSMIPAPGSYAIEYSVALVLGNRTSSHPFNQSLSGIAVGPKDRIYALGDGDVRIFAPDGDLLRRWKAPENALCLTVDSEERVYVGTPGRVGIFSSTGAFMNSFTVGRPAPPAGVTSIKTFGKEILVADATARYIRRYDAGGKQIGEIGTQSKTRGFMLPNRWLDLAVDAAGIIRATDTGRHRVSSWKLDGTPIGHFGKFGMSRPEDFVGCCNPVNIALAPDGNVVTAEKIAARVKVFDPSGKLIALIGPEHFDPSCTHLYLAVDSRNRILVADPVRREVKIFSPNRLPGGSRRA